MMTEKIHRGRGRPRKNTLPGVNIIIGKKPRSTKFGAAPKTDPHPPPLQWHNKRSRTVAVAVEGRAAPSSSSSSVSGSGRPFEDQGEDDDVLGCQCLADFEIPGPIPDLIDLMSDMSIFQDFFKDMGDDNLNFR